MSTETGPGEKPWLRITQEMYDSLTAKAAMADELAEALTAFLSRYQNKMVNASLLFSDVAELARAVLAKVADKAIDASVVVERERCVRRIIDVLSQVPPNDRPLDWRWVLNPASGGDGSPCMQANPKAPVHGKER